MTRTSWSKVNNHILYNQFKNIRRCIRNILTGNGEYIEYLRIIGSSPHQYYDRFNRYLGKPCEVCGIITINEITATIDHIKPSCLIRNTYDLVQLNKPDNIRLICEKCNNNKGSKYVVNS